ncbi:ZinT/AdcA family metal-binding protein [Staphylococcus sp. EG-SA-23]|nr:ZinT/AdcA family metal-binding protein [Staphylococcus sp. EG-SA-23]
MVILIIPSVEIDNWPTYYPSKLNKDQIKEEMLAH